MAKKNEPGSDTTNREIVITRLLDAPRELVFEVWTQPKHIAQWWGPNGFSTIIHNMEVRPGGTWDFIMHGPDGRDYKNKIIYTEVVKPVRLVYDHVSTPKFHVTVTFDEVKGKTKVTMRMLFDTVEEFENVVRTFNAIEGAKQTFSRLEDFVLALKNTERTGKENEKIAAAPFVMERVFDASIQTVWKALTDKTEMKQWYFDLTEFKPEVGFEFQFIGTGKDGDKRYVHHCKITEIIPGRKIGYSWRYEGFEGSSLVTFELFEEGSKTKLKLTHEGLETFPANNPDFARENFEEGWTFIINTSLNNFLEKSNS